MRTQQKKLEKELTRFDMYPPYWTKSSKEGYFYALLI